jgi:hypothetical protein
VGTNSKQIPRAVEFYPEKLATSECKGIEGGFWQKYLSLRVLKEEQMILV